MNSRDFRPCAEFIEMPDAVEKRIGEVGPTKNSSRLQESIETTEEVRAKGTTTDMKASLQHWTCPPRKLLSKNGEELKKRLRIDLSLGGIIPRATENIITYRYSCRKSLNGSIQRLSSSTFLCLFNSRLMPLHQFLQQHYVAKAFPSLLSVFSSIADIIIDRNKAAMRNPFVPILQPLNTNIGNTITSMLTQNILDSAYQQDAFFPKN